MDSLSSTLTSFDDINIICQTHESSAIGVCGEKYCKEKKFFCMKCIDSNDTCITNCRHELISLSEILFRFFIKQETKTINLLEINSMMENLKEIDRMQIAKNISDYIKKNKIENDKTIDNFKKKLSECTELSRDDNLLNNEKYLALLQDFKLENENINNLIKVGNNTIPDCLNNFNKVLINEYLNSEKISIEAKQNLIKALKIFANKDKFIKTMNSAGDIIQLNKFISSNENNNILETKIDSKLKELEEKLSKTIDDIQNSIIPSKNQVLVSKSSHLKFTTDPSNLIYKSDICETAHKSNSIDCVFCAFKSSAGDNLVCWGTSTFYIEIYDLKLEKIVKTFPNAHSSTIFSCRHYYERKNKQDILITSSYDKSIKLWCLKSNIWSASTTISAAHSGYYIYSVCILFDELETDKNYIISIAPNEFTKVWGFEGKYIREFGVNTESTYFINSWYDSKKKKHYIINANSTDVKSYEFKTGLLYKSYKGTPQTWHMSALVNELNNMNQLIESDGSGNVRIWDFDNATMLKMIQTSGINLRGICLWNDNYLFSSGSDYNVKLYDLKEGTLVKSFHGHSSTVCAVNKIVHPKYGECLISHALDGKLKLWTAK